VGAQTLEVRPVEAGELAAVAELTASACMGEGYSPDGEPALRDVASRVATATVLVAVRDSQVVGAVTVATRPGPWAERAVRGEAVVRMLATAPQARRAGVGEALVRSAVEVARADRCAIVRLSAQDDMVGAHRLYQRVGFIRTPSLDWSPVPGLLLRTFALPLVPWCGGCGEELTGEGHERCRAAAALDPPRWCAHCRRRMVVQVTPTGWTARCVEHGTTSG
jgi:ribosomal protein S18 acetylase RimI-like enzyme